MATKKKAKKKAIPKKAAKKSAAPKKGARQKSLPGMEDRAIAGLEDAALSYVEVRDERQALTLREVEAKKLVSALMHKQQKTKYSHAGIVIELVPEGEKVKVKIVPDGTDDTGGEVADDPTPQEEPPEDEPIDAEFAGVDEEA